MVHHLQDACKQGNLDLALSLLRVGCTMPALRGTPFGAALLESLLVSAMRSLHSAAFGAELRQTGSGDAHPGRRSSYTEQALAAAVETSSPSVLVRPAPEVRVAFATQPTPFLNSIVWQ